MDHEQARIKTLQSVLRESQQAKANLERRLTEQRKKRRVKEAELATVNGRLAQRRMVLNQKTEERDRAKIKAERLQALSSSLEHDNKKKREALQEIDKNINTFQENSSSDVAKFEEDLSCMAKQFKDARKEYSKPVLSQKINAEEANMKESKNKEAHTEESRLNTEMYLKSLEQEQTTPSEQQKTQEYVGQVMTKDSEELMKRLQVKVQEPEMARNE